MNSPADTSSHILQLPSRGRNLTVKGNPTLPSTPLPATLLSVVGYPLLRPNRPWRQSESVFQPLPVCCPAKGEKSTNI